MPSYTVTCEGGLFTAKTLKPTGSVVEMSEKDAASLPLGTVELLARPTPPVEIKPFKSEAKASKESKP